LISHEVHNSKALLSSLIRAGAPTSQQQLPVLHCYRGINTLNNHRLTLGAANMNITLHHPNVMQGHQRILQLLNFVRLALSSESNGLGVSAKPATTARCCLRV